MTNRFHCVSHDCAQQLLLLKSSSYAKLGVKITGKSLKTFKVEPLDQLVTGDMVYSLGPVTLFISPILHEKALGLNIDFKDGSWFITKRQWAGVTPKRQKSTSRKIHV